MGKHQADQNIIYFDRKVKLKIQDGKGVSTVSPAVLLDSRPSTAT